MLVTLVVVGGACKDAGNMAWHIAAKVSQK
jgi:hypothetical protein